jgi:hypothetical protein
MDPWKKYITYDWRNGEICYEEQPSYETGTPAWLYHGLGVSFRLPERAYDETEIVEAFRAAFGPRLDALRETYSTEWDGHNRVGRHGGDPERYHDEIYGISERVEEWAGHQGVEVWDASDWYCGGLTTSQILDELDAAHRTETEIYNTILEQAEAEGVRLHDVEQFARWVKATADECAEGED